MDIVKAKLNKYVCYEFILRDFAPIKNPKTRSFEWALCFYCVNFLKNR